MRWTDIIWLPATQETIVLPFSAEETRWMIWKVIKPFREGDAVPDTSEEALLFNGKMDKFNFVIWRKVRYPENFSPLIKGHIEPTARGCIVFLKYRMFFSTNFFLVFWSMIAFMMSIFMTLFLEEFGYAAGALVLGLVNYTVVMTGFNLQVRKSRELIHQLFERASGSF